MHEVMRETAFKDHTYSHTTMGYLEDIKDYPNQYEYAWKFFNRVYRPENSTVIVVGMNRTDGGLAGDVDFDAVSAVAGAITPVPGGVGPMTIAMLLSNTLKAARLQSSGRVGRTPAAGA